MTNRLLTILLLSCLAAVAANAATLDLDGAGWSVLGSESCPKSPSTVAVNGKPAWRLEVDGSCKPQSVLRDANDELRAAFKEASAALVVKLHVANANLRSAEDGGADAYATVVLQGKGADTQAPHRLFASRSRIKLVNGSHTVTIPLDRTNWTGVGGESGSEATWSDVLANLDRVGIALGGEHGDDRGVEGSGGLYMLEFRLD